MEMLIDRYLPRFDVTLVEHTIADADVPTTWKALRGLDFAQVHTPLTDAAMCAVGRFWQPDIQWYDVTGMTPEQFAAFDEPGWGRIASNFSLRPYGIRTLISYEVRTVTADPGSAARFARYWWLVRPFVGHIMRAGLDAVRVEAEHASPR